MDNCSVCKNATWDYCEGYSSKECGMSGNRGYVVVEGCKKECEEFFNDGENCPEFDECEYDDDDDYLISWEFLIGIIIIIALMLIKL